MTNMIKLFHILLIVAVTAPWSAAKLPLEKCAGQDFGDLQLRIGVDPCGSTICKLTKGTNTTVNIQFNPKKEVKSLSNNVHADILGVPLPFAAVSGKSACGHVMRADTGEPAPCPLQPDIEYKYQIVFYVEHFYPTIQVKVHWSLQDGTHDVICFEIPAAIRNAKPKKN